MVDMATLKRNSGYLLILIIVVISFHQSACQGGFTENKRTKEPLDRSINEIKENVSTPPSKNDFTTETDEIDNEITTEMGTVLTEKSTRPALSESKPEKTTQPPTPKPTTGSKQPHRERIDPMDQYLLDGILDIVDEKFDTINKRLMTLERGVNNLQYYNVRSFRVVNTHLHAVDTMLHNLHTQVGQSEQQNKVFEQSIAGIKHEVIDLQTLNNGMFQAIEQNLVHFHQDIEEKLIAVRERVEQSNAHIDQINNETAEIKTSVEHLESTQKDIHHNSEISVMFQSEIIQKSALCVNLTSDIKGISESLEERTKQINNTIEKVAESVSIVSTDTYDIKQGLATALTNISIAKFDQNQFDSINKGDNSDKQSYQEFRVTNSNIQMSCGKMLEILDEKLKHINISLSDEHTKENKCDTRSAFPADFKNQSRKLLRALSTVNENVFQSVTLYRHTGNLIERVISDTELIASEQVRLREELVAYLMNGTFDLFNQSIPDFAEFIASRNKKEEEAKNVTQTCSVTKSLVDEILKISFNGTQLVDMLTDLATTSSTSMHLSLNKLDQEINRLSKLQEQPLLSAPFYKKQETFIRDDPKVGGNTQIKDIQNKTDWIYQLSEAIASNTGWIPYVFHNLRFVENQMNKTLKLVTSIDAKSEEILIRQRANMAIMFKPKQNPTTLSPVTQTPPSTPTSNEVPGNEDASSGNGCSGSSANQSAHYEHMLTYVYSTNMKLNRLIPALTNLLGEPEPYIALVDGGTDREGRVEVYYKGQWGTIAGKFSHVEASYVCRKLGYLGGISAGSGHFGAGSGQFWNLNVTCLRTRWCSAVSHVTDTSLYNHSEDVGVICGHMLRLTQSNEDEEAEVARNVGKLEIYHHNNWLPVCAKGWGRGETDVACKQLGFREGSATTVKDESLSDSNWMINVTCKGNEDRLDACVFDSFGSNGCPDLKYVSLICS